MDDKIKGLFSITQAAAACGLSRSTLMRMEEKGLLTPLIYPKATDGTTTTTTISPVFYRYNCSSQCDLTQRRRPPISRRAAKHQSFSPYWKIN